MGQSNGRPIGYRPVPAGTPRWGAAWKKATATWYLHTMAIGGSASNMPNRYHYYDLDPTYTNAFGGDGWEKNSRCARFGHQLLDPT